MVFLAGAAALLCSFGSQAGQILAPSETTGTWVLTKGACLNNFGNVPFAQGTQANSPDLRPTWHMTTMENGGTYGWSCWHIASSSAPNATARRRVEMVPTFPRSKVFPPWDGTLVSGVSAGVPVGTDESSGTLVTSMCEAFLGQLDFEDGEMVNVKRNELGTSTSYFQKNGNGQLSGTRFKMTLAQPGHAQDPRLFSPVVTKSTYEKVSDDPGPMPEWDTETTAASVTKRVVAA